MPEEKQQPRGQVRRPADRQEDRQRASPLHGTIDKLSRNPGQPAERRLEARIQDCDPAGCVHHPRRLIRQARPAGPLPRAQHVTWAEQLHGAAPEEVRPTAQIPVDDEKAPEMLQAVTHERSLDELQEKQQEMIDDRERARAGVLEFPGISGAAYDLNIDVINNVVEVIADVPEATLPATTEAFRLRYGESVVVESGEIVTPDACNRNDCRYNLRAGFNVHSADWACTSAFTVQRPNGTRQVLSAGHCSQWARYHAGQRYGDVLESYFGADVDAQRHSVDRAPFQTRPWIYDSNELKEMKVHSVGTYGGMYVGQVVQMSGVTSGHRDGAVLSKTYAPGYVSGTRFIQASYCSADGDSGAPIYSEVGRAHGIHSGGIDSRSCPDPLDFGIFGHIEFAQARLGVTVVTAPAI